MKFAVNFEFWHQTKAMTVRNLLIKRREIKKTLSEIAIPVYTLSLLIAIKLLIPNPNFPPVTVPQESPDMYSYLYGNITVAPLTKNVQIFLEKMNDVWTARGGEKINFDLYENKEDIFDVQRNNPAMVYIALIFDDDPIRNNSISYKIRTNPFYDTSPSPSKLYEFSHQCRKVSANKLTKKILHRHHHNNNDQQNEEISCPAIHYIQSGFVALQTLVDVTKISLVLNSSVQLPDYRLVLFPKPAYTANWLMVFHKVIPLYVVIALSQFITYLLVQLVGEKERKIKEGMKIMGLRELVFWCSWFNIYATYSIVLSSASTAILFLLGVFNNTNCMLIFSLVLLYSITVIFFSFMISPFFDKSRTAGILGNFLLNLISIMYFVHTLIDPSEKQLLWLVSLLSPSGFALAIDKAMAMDLAGKGLNFGNVWDGPGMSFGESLLIMAFDALIYATLAYYFYMILPSEYERKQSPWFCFKTSYWCNKAPVETIEFDELDRYSVTNPDLETVSDSMKEFRAIQITNLCKSFKKSTINVINGINMTIYEGEITAILGHNGAGKTTLFNILTGLTEPTSGTIKVFGYDVRNPSDVSKIRRMIGVCPQYDILFERLTPREHLRFFATLRGLTSEKIDEEVQKMLMELYLTDKSDSIAKTLSGGQKRKLSVGIATIGNPKIIILDEPTAGVDPPARRHLWSLLQNRKKGKVILLTTHFMDEADILADRIAVISKGCVRCCGSSIFLKNKFGIGYHLTLILNDKSNENSIVKMIKEHIPNAERTRRHGYELSFVLPHDSVGKFPPLFEQIEIEIKSTTKNLGIENYGVSMTTLEEVFLYLEQGQHDNAGKLAVELLKGQPMTNFNSTGSIDTIRNMNARSSIVYDPTNWNTVTALLKMRTIRVLRDVHKLYVMVLLPIVFLATGIILNKLSHEVQPLRSLVLNHNVYKEESQLVVPSEEFSNYSSLSSNLYAGSFPGLLDLPTHLGALAPLNKTCCSPMSLTIYYNDSFVHSLPIILNSITSTLLGYQIDIVTEPFKMEYKQNEYSFSRCSSAFFLGIVFVLVPVSLSADLVYDKEIKAKNQLRINGVTFMQYFSSYFILLISMLLLIFFILVCLIASLHVEGLDTPCAISTLVILLVAYCPAAVLATACLSYFFEKTDSVQSILPNVTSLVGGVPFIVVASLDMLGIANNLVFALHVLFSSTNFVYVPFAIIYYVNSVYRENDEHAPFIEYVNKETVALLMGCVGQLPALWVILKILDSRNKNIEKSKITIDGTQDEGDDDVKAERRKVNNIVNDQENWPIIVVQNLRKEFTNAITSSYISCLKKEKHADEDNKKKLAIRDLSLAVNTGDVLGLLGHNGAGKTTTMRIITMEEKETAGKVFIKGNCIRESVDIAFRMIGYCPQHDALWSSLTIREHLNVYASIRGISKDQINNIVNKYIEGLQISDHADKQVSCCSGGTKRKLSFALAMIGNPKLVLLDEPSTGMDPRSKRYLWDAIISSFQGTKGAILTTHSMEEADALCSRVGIMVKGQLRCLGSTQYLKNLYGAGYTLEIKLKPHGDMDDVKNFVATSFRNAIPEEEFADRLVFEVPQSTVDSLADCFLNLENAKYMYDIQEYSFSQTTLEQVYLKFAHYEDTTETFGNSTSNENGTNC